MQRDHLFRLGWSNTFEVVRVIRIDQDDLLVVEGWGLTEPTLRTHKDQMVRWLRDEVTKLAFFGVWFLVGWSSLGVIVHLGFGSDQGTCTAQVIVILD